MPDGYEISGKSVRVYFYWEGKVCKERIGPHSQLNIDKAKRLSEIIRYELKEGSFDYSRHFPDSPRVKKSTFGHYLDVLLAIKKNELADSSYRAEHQKSVKYIKPRWGSCNIEKIDHLEIQEWIQEELRNTHKLASKTIKDIVSIVRQVFNLYCTNTKKTFNPANGIKIKLPDKQDPDPFTLEEINKILSTPTTRVQELNLMQFALWDGPRISEVLALAWEDVVSVEKGIVRYERAKVLGKYKATKTRRSTRTHTLLKPAREALQAQFRLTGHLKPTVIEYTDRDNQTIRTKKLRFVFLNTQSLKPHKGDQDIRERFWETHLKRAEVRYRPPSQARHTFISQMLSTGAIPLHWISDHVGHSTIDMIQKTYGKWIKSDGADLHQTIEKIFDL